MNPSIGQNIRKRRKEVGLTQEKLANLVQLSRSHIASIENDAYDPSLATLSVIAEALHTDTAALINPDVESLEIDEDIRQIQRARKNMSEKEKERMMKILTSAFEDFFDE